MLKRIILNESIWKRTNEWRACFSLRTYVVIGTLGAAQKHAAQATVIRRSILIDR